MMPVIKTNPNTLFESDRYHVIMMDNTDFFIDDTDALTDRQKLNFKSILDLTTNSFTKDLICWHDFTQMADFEIHNLK